MDRRLGFWMKRWRLIEITKSKNWGAYVGETLKNLGLGCNSYHVVESSLPHRGVHWDTCPIYVMSIRGHPFTTSWHMVFLKTISLTLLSLQLISSGKRVLHRSFRFLFLISLLVLESTCGLLKQHLWCFSPILYVTLKFYTSN